MCAIVRAIHSGAESYARSLIAARFNVSQFASTVRTNLQGFLVCVLFTFGGASYGQTVTVAGFAFGGDHASAKQQFPLSWAAIEHLNMGNLKGSHALTRKVTQLAEATKNSKVTLNTSSLANLKNSDRALVVALVLTAETTYVEKFTAYNKIFISLQAEALLFDFKAQTVVRSYPINVVIFHASEASPTDRNLQALVSQLLFADDDKSLIYQFARKLETLSVPTPGTKTIQVRRSNIAPEVLALYPEALRSGQVAQAMLANTFSSALSSKTGVPLIPSKFSHATGVMKVRFEDMYDYDLKLPDGDYVFDLNLKRLAKIQHAKNNVGASYIYGAFADISFSEPLLQTTFLLSEFKNGEVAVVPADRESADDFPAYQDAINGLFTKLSDAIEKPDSTWLRTAASAQDVQNQMKKTKGILEISKK